MTLAALSLVAISLVALASADVVSAAPRKPHHAVPEATNRDTDTSTTSTIPAKPPKSAAQSPSPAIIAKDEDETLPPPFHLPPAPRKRMRDCGLKWQAMKTSGEVGEEIWRDFASRCLSAATGPVDKRSER